MHGLTPAPQAHLAQVVRPNRALKAHVNISLLKSPALQELTRTHTNTQLPSELTDALRGNYTVITVNLLRNMTTPRAEETAQQPTRQLARLTGIISAPNIHDNPALLAPSALPLPYCSLTNSQEQRKHQLIESIATSAHPVNG